ncbi:hypothetical protein IGI04_028521, partial [Brassica rapa subsp. trilocularis]
NWREHPPSSYSLKVHNFSQLEKSTTVSDDKYQSRPFSSADAISLFNTNQETDRLPKRQQNNNRGFCGTPFLCLQQKRKQVLYYSRSATSDYSLSFSLPTFVFQLAITFIFLDLEVRRFNALKTVWGLQQFLPLDTFNDLKNGYIFEGGHCEFGVDVIVASPLTNWEILSFDEKLSKPNDTLKEDEKIFVQANLRLNVWFKVQNASWGWNKFMSLAELRKTYLDNKEHALSVEMEFKKLTFVVCGTQKLHKYNIPIYIPQLFNYFEQHVPLTINLAWNGVTSLIVSPTMIVG